MEAVHKTTVSPHSIKTLPGAREVYFRRIRTGRISLVLLCSAIPPGAHVQDQTVDYCRAAAWLRGAIFSHSRLSTSIV